MGTGQNITESEMEELLYSSMHDWLVQTDQYHVHLHIIIAGSYLWLLVTAV